MDPFYQLMELNAWREFLWGRGHRLDTYHGLTWPDLEASLPIPDLIGIVLCGGEFPQCPIRFECAPGAEQILGLMKCPEPHRSRWLEIVKELDTRPEIDYFDFLAGPGSWMLCRVLRFKEVVLWSPRGLATHAIWDFLHADLGVQFSPQAAPFFPTDNELECMLPHVISVGHKHFADVIATCLPIAFAYPGCFVADRSGSEVFWVDNDEGIFVSIPRLIEREKLIRELEAAPSPFKNASGLGKNVDMQRPEENGT